MTGHSSWVYSVAFDPDGRTVLSGSWDDSLKLWDVSTGKLIRTLTGHTDDVNAVVYSPGGTMALSAADDRTVRLWDLETGKLIRTFNGHTDKVFSVAISWDGRQATVGQRGQDHPALGRANRRSDPQLHGTHRDRQFGEVLDRRGQALSGSEDQTLKLWDLTR